MKFNSFLLWGTGFSLLLTGCIDDKYDLSDIDTTSEFKINNLVLPVNLDPVTLDDIITVEEGDQLKKVTINGKTFYAVEQSGTFESDDIEVNRFAAEPSPLNANEVTFTLSSKAPANRNGRKADGNFKEYFNLEKVYEPLEYEANDIDPSVRGLSYMYFTNVDFILNIRALNPDNLSSTLENVGIILPKGLKITDVKANGYTFNPTDYRASEGLLTIKNINIVDNAADIVITANAIDLSYYPSAFRFNADKNVGEFNLDSEFSIKEGCRLVMSGAAQQLASLGDELKYSVNYGISRLEATSILGEIQYNLEGTGLNLDPISLDNLPEFLADDQTNLIITNPQIYLNLNNPVGQYGLSYQSSINISAFRTNSTEEFPLGTDIKVAGKEGSFNYMLASDPNAVEDIPAEYAGGLNKISYNRLGYILSGQGLPNSLDLKLVNPMIPCQKLTEPFELGTKIPGMKGSYCFLAPLALDGDSRIVYTKTKDGWWSEDLADLTITELMLNATVSSTIPMSASLAVYPLDKDGHRIQGLEIIPVEIQANEPGKNLTFLIKGEIRNLDGVFITATVYPDGSKETLTPTQTITLENIKVTVSGNYTKKF